MQYGVRDPRVETPWFLFDTLHQAHKNSFPRYPSPFWSFLKTYVTFPFIDF